MWQKIAHRGAAGTRPELTLPAFERALELSVDMIEIDVQLTKDRQLVVLHDLELGRTVAGSAAVRDLDLRQIQDLDAGSWFDPAYAATRVPSLTDVFAFLNGRAALNTEIKSPAADWTATAEVLVAMIRDFDAIATTLVSSFSMGALRAVREIDRDIRLGVLWYEANVHDSFAYGQELAAEAIHPHHSLVSPNIVRRAREAGLAINTWTVNDTERMRELVDLGVDGLISDFPERFSEIARSDLGES